ncbi:MAG: response regulator [Caldimonas sp.]
MHSFIEGSDRDATLLESDAGLDFRPASKAPRATPTVLVVDDERDVLDVLEAALSADGYRVATACNGADAIDMALSICPDVVITDLLMPVVDGIELAKTLRANPTTASIRIVLSSGVVERSVKALFRDYDAFLQKPYELRDLQRVVARMLEV